MLSLLLFFFAFLSFSSSEESSAGISVDFTVTLSEGLYGDSSTVTSGASFALSDVGDGCDVGDKGTESSDGSCIVTDFFMDEVRLWIEGLSGAGLRLAISSSGFR